MLQVRASSRGTPQRPAPLQLTPSNRVNKIDTEMTMLLRHAFAPLFDAASSWEELREKLIARGYDFRFENGQLILVELWHGSKVCSCRYLGFSLQTLTDRFGKLRARPPRNGESFGDLAI